MANGGGEAGPAGPEAPPPGEKRREPSPEYQAAVAATKARDAEAFSMLYKDYVAVVVARGTPDEETVRLPAPTLGVIFLFDERESYFMDSKLGLGRLLWVLNHQYDDGGAKIIRLFAGYNFIPDAEARDLMVTVKPHLIGYYYEAFKEGTSLGWEHAKKKLAEVFSSRIATNLQSQKARGNLSQRQDSR